MTAAQHVYEIYIKAPPERVWQAITDPDYTRRYFFATAIETSLEPGSGYRYLLPGGDPAADGVIEEVEPGRRLRLTWRALYDAELADEPPGRVEWVLDPANEEATVTRVRVRHFDLAMSPGTWADVRHGWVAILDGMKTVLETGEELGPVEVEPVASVDETAADWHRTQAVNANNSTWALLDGRTMTGDEAFDALGRAYAAAHHWRAATGPESIQTARAAWLCSRVHNLLGDGEAALRLAERCADLVAAGAQNVADFDRAYALEARARSLACLGRDDEARPLQQAALAAAAEVADEEDRKIVDGDLAAPPWFGLTTDAP